MNDDGTMARLPELMKFAERHQLKIATVADLIEYRRTTEKLVCRDTEVLMPTAFGDFRAVTYVSLLDQQTHLALVKGDISKRDSVLWYGSTRSA